MPEDKLNPRLWRYLSVSLVLFCILWLILGLFHNAQFPDTEIISLQLTSLVAFYIGLYVGLKLNLHSLFIWVFIYQLILTVALYLYFSEYLGEPLGYDPIDSLLYRRTAELSMRMNFSEFWDYLKTESSGLNDISDKGYPIIQRLIFIVGGNSSRGVFLMCLFNVFIHVYTTYSLYRFASQLLPAKDARLAALLWGINSCAVWLNASGLKEQIFVCLVTNAACQLQLYFSYKRWRNLLLTSLFVAGIWFFRYYISLFFILIFIGKIWLRPLYEKFFGIFCISMFISVIFGLSILVYFIPELYFIQLFREKALSEGMPEGTLFWQMAGYILAFIGPLPSILDTPRTVNLVIITYSLIKTSISIFGILAILKIIRHKITKLYPWVTLILFNTLLTITGGMALSYRYVYVTMPVYFVLIFYGFREYHSNKWLKYSYLIIMMIAIYVFNQRSM